MMKRRIIKLGLLPLLISSGMVFADSSPQAKPADNTARNQRDRHDQTLTSEDQSQGSKSDVEVTRQIRRALTKRDNLSTDAQNIKIITLKNVVTLRGPVKSEAERQEVGALARQVAGSKQVKNETEIAR